jgi:hypothetical protein
MFAPWFIWRFTFPLAIAGAITYATWGGRYHAVYGNLLWVVFIAHLAVTWAFHKTHVLDTGSFFFLLFAFAAIAELSESHGRELALQTSLGVGAFVMYAISSYVGRRRVVAHVDAVNSPSVSKTQIAVAFLMLVLAAVVCSTSKAAVGFLFVPAFFFIPITLLYYFLQRTGPNSGS